MDHDDSIEILTSRLTSLDGYSPESSHVVNFGVTPKPSTPVTTSRVSLNDPVILPAPVRLASLALTPLAHGMGASPGSLAHGLTPLWGRRMQSTAPLVSSKGKGKAKGRGSLGAVKTDKEKRIKKVVMIIATLMILASMILVGASFSMSDHIDDMGKLLHISSSALYESFIRQEDRIDNSK